MNPRDEATLLAEQKYFAIRNPGKLAKSLSHLVGSPTDRSVCGVRIPSFAPALRHGFSCTPAAHLENLIRLGGLCKRCLQRWRGQLFDAKDRAAIASAWPGQTHKRFADAPLEMIRAEMARAGIDNWPRGDW